MALVFACGLVGFSSLLRHMTSMLLVGAPAAFLGVWQGWPCALIYIMGMYCWAVMGATLE